MKAPRDVRRWEAGPWGLHTCTHTHTQTHTVPVGNEQIEYVPKCHILQDHKWWSGQVSRRLLTEAKERDNVGMVESLHQVNLPEEGLLIIRPVTLESLHSHWYTIQPNLEVKQMQLLHKSEWDTARQLKWSILEPTLVCIRKISP